MTDQNEQAVMAAVDLSLIRTDGGTQPRAAIDTHLVETYAEDMAHGAVFPPLVVFFDGVAHWLADGFHRFFAAKGCGLAEFPCDLRQGTQRDAILFSVGANASHGLRRTNEDKRRAVLTLLNDENWSSWSDREVARVCQVSGPFVAKLRPAPEPTANVCSEDRTYTNRHGSISSMATANIGRRPEEDRPVFDHTDAGRDAAPTLTPSPAFAPSAPPRESVAAFRSNMNADGPIFDGVQAIAAAWDLLPHPEEAARRYPKALRHTFDHEQARAISAWFNLFAMAWREQNGDTHVAAE